MRSNDIEALGALYTYLTHADYAYRVQPPLSFSEYREFALQYLERCFREDPRGDWSHTRYAAAWDLASWFGRLWEAREKNKKELAEIKEWLARTYKGVDEVVKRCIVDGTLEHLFEDRKIAKYFSDWQQDPSLAIAYREAMDWSEKGGSSGLLRDKGT